jgi:hypothetical protein
MGYRIARVLIRLKVINSGIKCQRTILFFYQLKKRSENRKVLPLNTGNEIGPAIMIKVECLYLKTVS